MASGFFALLDDIGSLMDDVVVMSKITTKKTAGILGDDLAVNAEKATGFVSSRELPVIWAISKGSMLNKLIILPIAFLLSAFAPWAVKAALVLGGIYLAFEGVEKIYEGLVHRNREEEDPSSEMEIENHSLTKEKEKIKSAIVTDFILSVEIVIIALGTVIGKPLLFQILVVSLVAVLATVGVYGVVALIVRMDDFGFRLVKLNAERKNTILGGIGYFLIRALPWVIKSLSVIGTVALLLVSGGIFSHNIDVFHHLLEGLPGFLRDFIIGFAVGLAALLLVKIFKWIKGVVF
ncbi:DUF808 domain-containing protein [Aestuariivivens sediminicola]|uniref:DUF808 domain-containing protein n=1 Tax=Aestuariivivens sediminicola TaxID=2913560 RepID=UPI001F59A1A5|nr:DUF808 domain-containing protein [Aestuariivivens sediminicola]